MALTVSSRFRLIKFTNSNARITIAYTFDDGIIETLGALYGRDLPSDHIDRGKLDILQEIYASADGFLDDTGTSLAILLSGFYSSGRFILDIAELEDNGFVNPLIPGSYDRVQMLQQTLGVFQTEVEEIETDATSGRKDIKTHAGTVPVPRVAESIMQSLEDFFLQVISGETQRVISLFLSTDQAVTTANAGNRAQIKALLLWLEDVRDSGDVVDIDAITEAEIEAGTQGNRIYEFDQETGSTVRFTCNAFGLQVLNAGRFVRLHVTSTADSPELFNYADVAAYFDGQEIVISTTEADEKPPFGSLDVEAKGESLRLDGGRIRIEDRHPVIEVLDENDKPHRIIMGYGVTRAYDDLQNAPDSRKYPPVIYAPSVVIHFGPDADANGGIRLHTPPEQIPVGDSGDVNLIFHNREDPTAADPKTFTLHKWGSGAVGGRILRLLAGEQTTFRVVKREDGTGEVIDAVPVSREFLAAGANVGHLNNLGGYLTDGTSNYRLRPVRFPLEATASVYKIHSEALVIGTGAFASGQPLDSISAGDLAGPNAVLIDKDGHLSAKASLSVSTGASASGTIPPGHGLVFFRKRGFDTLRGPQEQSKATLGQNEQDTWSLNWELDVVSGDVVIPMFRYRDTASLSWSQVQEDSIDLSFRLTEFVHQEYTP